jgi:hypothetical protein
MKSFRRLSLGYFVALAALVLAGTAQAETIHNKGIIRAIRGSAQVSNNRGQSWSNAKVGGSLSANSQIKTSADSTVDVFLGENGPVVRVTPDTTMGIDKLDLDSTGIEKVIETQLDLRNGRILGSVKKMAAASKYEVKTPVGVAGIRGTEYSINSRGQVSIVTGSAMVVYVVDNQILPAAPVGAGQTINPPPNVTTPPAITPTPSTVGSDVGIIMRGVTVNPNGTITVTLSTGGSVTTATDGTTTVVVNNPVQNNGGPVGPGPGPITEPNKNILPGSDLSQIEPNSNTGGTLIPPPAG